MSAALPPPPGPSTVRKPAVLVSIEFHRWFEHKQAARVCRKGFHMNPYAIVDATVGATGPGPLRARLMAWHDAMVAHERRLRSGSTNGPCDDECPHVEAQTLWAEALEVLGPRARELTFLRSRATRSDRER